MIHLAGASIAGRFTPGRKQEIHDSRIIPTRRLAELAAASAPAGAAAGTAGLRAFVTASAIGIYGPDRGDEVLTETSARGDGFLADVVAGWEDATTPAARAGIRTVQVRTGIVQTPRGGMLRLLYPLFAAGLGGRGRRPAVAGLDRPGRPAGHLPAGGDRPVLVRPGQRGRSRAGAQLRVHRDAGRPAAPARAGARARVRPAAAARRRGCP